MKLYQIDVGRLKPRAGAFDDSTHIVGAVYLQFVEIRHELGMQLERRTIAARGDVLANKTADHIAAEQKRLEREFNVNEAAEVLIDHKISNVTNWFKSSPRAHKGIRNRYKAEKTAFQ